MGNSGSSHHLHHHHHQQQQQQQQQQKQQQQQQGPSNDLLSAEMGRGWTHSFPRELARHHSQPPGHKVLPEPPNQRLRATNNGSIIHNGGTISGRRPSALTLPHDHNKQEAPRNRSSSTSNLGQSRSSDHYHQHHQQYLRRHHHQNQSRISYCETSRTEEDARNRDNEISSDLKRFGSEPDLRHSLGAHEERPESRRTDFRLYPDHRDARERGRERESRYRSKKYKAPAPPPPPAANGTEDGSSPDSIKWERDREDRNSRGRCRTDPSAIHPPPPPRRSRLFKTRAETKRTQANWNGSSSSALHHQPQGRDSSENERRRSRQREEDDEEEEEEEEEEDDEEETIASWSQCREDSRRRYKIWEGKSTLQRSMSSPEFQAELMQVAKKVRTKLQYFERGAPVGEAVTSMDRKLFFGKNRSFQDFSKISRSQQEEINCTYEKRVIQDRRRKRRSEESRSYEERSFSAERDRFQYTNPNFPKLREKRLEETDARNHRKPLRERSETVIEQGWWKVDKKIQLDSKTRNELSKSQERSRSRSSESPALVSTATTRHTSREKMEVRGQGSGRESTPESLKIRRIDKENFNPRRRTENSRERRESNENEWQESHSKMEKKREAAKKEKGGSKTEEDREKSRNTGPAAAFSKPKTFYFGMDDSLTKESRECVNGESSRVQTRHETDNLMIDQDNQKPQGEIDDIALKLRPTLPKKQPEIPRFSPSAAWRLLSALETPGPTMSTVSEEIPVMFEERIERFSRPPPPLLALQGPRSSHDKSGDSGISGDAGAANEDSVDVSGSPNRIKPIPLLRPVAWTPQQDLGEDSSSDAGLDSPPPPHLASPVKFSTRPHVFSLSLPREENHRLYPYNNPEPKTKDIFSFNSLQKLKRSVSGALGFSPLELEKKRVPLVESLDDNWLLSTSAPTSLQHNPMDQNLTYTDFNVAHQADEEGEQQEIDEQEKSDFQVPIMMPPSFSYLASGGHVMYLPDSIRAGAEGSAKQNLIENNRAREKKNEEEKKTNFSFNNNTRRSLNYYSKFRKLRDDDDYANADDKFLRSRGFSKSCENISYRAKGANESPERGPENLQDRKDENRGNNINNNNNNSSGKVVATSKPKRFTFQSTVRQIERRRLADRLSREAEAKERQRKNELEAMRKVEEEFQQKRAREKANIRQQLRLYSMDENMSSLPTIWDSSQISRAEPDGAPSSSASSPISAPPEKLPSARKNSASSEEYHRKSGTTLDSRTSHQQQQYQHHPNREHREYKDYRPKYYNWTPSTVDSSSHNVEYKQTTVHPKVVYDIPKSSHVFVDANTHANKPVNVNSTPRSDNYRKDFAHGAIAARSSLASSDSEISQPNTRPHSRQTGSKSKPLRSRSTSPTRSVDEDADTSSENEQQETPVEAIKQERNPIKDFILNGGIQPFSNQEKSYRPISFNPQPQIQVQAISPNPAPPSPPPPPSTPLSSQSIVI